MSKFLITGPQRISGEYKIQGSKNAATPIIAATLLIHEECVIDNVSRVADVDKMLKIIESLGAAVSWTGSHQLTINAKNITLPTLDEQLVKTMRSSVLLVGPLLARFGEVRIPEPGGCFLGNRPLDTHLEVVRQFGGTVSATTNSQGKIDYQLTISKLQGAAVTLPEFSVTATENAIMLGVLAPGETLIKLAAGEPHVQDLIRFLRSAGADITELPGHVIRIRGQARLGGVHHQVIPDMLEIGTLLVAGALIGDQLTINDVNLDHLDIILLKLKQIGARIITDGPAASGSIKISASADLRPFHLQALPYPGFPTDLQEPFSLLATQSQGSSMIHDPLFEDRMRHIPELVKMGAQAIVCDSHRSIITGPTPLSAYEVKSPNIRAGGMFVIAGLLATGTTIIHDVEQTIDRGYERWEERLSQIGAVIKRVD